MTTKVTAKVIFDFAAHGPNEMSIKLGETVEILEKGKKGDMI